VKSGKGDRGNGSIPGGAARHSNSKSQLGSWADDAPAPGMWPASIAKLYGLTIDGDGAGQCVGIIALGGGYLPSDLESAATQAGRSLPQVFDHSVNGATNNFGGGTVNDEEIALDIQVVAALAPAARIVVYFADNSQAGLANAIQEAVFDEVNRPTVLSVSWGSAEKFWSPNSFDIAQAALAEASKRNITVAAAAGDYLATGGLTDKKAHVAYPASSPLVLGCGGTNMVLSADNATIENEFVWNDGRSGTGGGISDSFPVPDYQRTFQLPPSVNDGGKRRGVPDVAAASSGTPGYRIILNGGPLSKSGTSAATPLWAALVALANATRGQPLGMINSYLYANPWLCRQVIAGSNRIDGIGYDAGPGWNACTGLGVPVGAGFIAALASKI
jgi:kumamolisin